MHILDPKWSELATGYQAVLEFQTRLENEFSRAFQAGQRLEFQRELAGWQKKRRAFIVLAVIAPLSIIILCLAAIYFHEASCVIAYWAMLVLIIVITLAVAGRSYIVEATNRPALETSQGVPIHLDQRWWASLLPRNAMAKPEKKGGNDYLDLLSGNLPDACLVSHDPFFLIINNSGLWLFRNSEQAGTIIRQDGVWKQVNTIRDKLVKKQIWEQILEPAPDDDWLQYRSELVGLLEKQLPQQVWMVKKILGGVIFTHPGVRLEKARIQGNTAAYGTLNAWLERMHSAPALDGFTLDTQLQVLDSLSIVPSTSGASARDEAERLYKEAVSELSQILTTMVK